MILLYGLIAIAQLLFLPGFVVCLIQNKVKDFFDFFLVSLIYSLLINSVLGFVILILFNEQTRIIFFGIISIEIIIIIFYIIKRNPTIVITLGSPIILILLVSINVLYLTNLSSSNIINDVGTFIYYAESFAGGVIPDLNKTQGYPQLFSILWAILLKIVGVNELEIIFIFVKFLMFFIFLIGNLVWYKFIISSKKTYFTLAFIIYNFFIFVYFDKFVGSGMREVEVASMALLLFYFVYKYKHESKQEFLFYAVLVSALAANMKQSGLMLIIAIAVILILERKKISFTQYLYCTVVLILGLFWISYIEYNIYLGQSSSDSPYLQKGIHQGRNLLWRVIYAFGKFSVRALFGELPFFVIPISLSILLLYFLSILHTKYILTYLLSTLYLIIWAAYYGYDLRNLGIIIPFISLLSAESIVNFSNISKVIKIKQFSLRLNRLRIFLIILFLVIIVFLLNNKYTLEYFFRQQQDLQKKYDEPDRIEYLIDLINENDIKTMGSQFSGILRVNKYSNIVERIDLNLSSAKLEYIKNAKEFEYLYVRKNGGLTNSGKFYIDKLISSDQLLIVEQDKHYYLFKSLD